MSKRAASTISRSAPSALTEYTAWLASSLSRYEKLAKSLVRHKAEKGRIVESVVKAALREVLPRRFCLGTGFAITASGKTSSQLDVVIYDEMSNAPIILEGGVGLFPIECIYGFVEVKSVFDARALDSCTKAIGVVRQLAQEKRYIVYGRSKNEDGKPVVGAKVVADTLPPRSFVFAINSTIAALDVLEEKLRVSAESNGAHIHGLIVTQKDWFFRQIPFENPNKFSARDDYSLAAFCVSVLDAIQSFPVRPASMGHYLGLE
jgi:hypothetical protein